MVCYVCLRTDSQRQRLVLFQFALSSPSLRTGAAQPVEKAGFSQRESGFFDRLSRMNFKAPKDSYTEKERRILGKIKNLFPASSGDGAALMVGGGEYEDGGNSYSFSVYSDTEEGACAPWTPWRAPDSPGAQTPSIPGPAGLTPRPPAERSCAIRARGY